MIELIHIIVSQKELQEIFSNNQFNDDLVTIAAESLKVIYHYQECNRKWSIQN